MSKLFLHKDLKEKTMGLFGKIFKSDNARNIEKLERIAKKVEALEDKYKYKKIILK